MRDTAAAYVLDLKASLSSESRFVGGCPGPIWLLNLVDDAAAPILVIWSDRHSQTPSDVDEFSKQVMAVASATRDTGDKVTM